MKLIAAEYDDNEDLARVQVSMSKNELALLARIVGGIAPKDISDLAGSYLWGETLDDLCGAIGIINRHFDGGVDDVVPRFSIRDLQPR